MPNVSATKKAVRATERKTKINKSRRTRVKTFSRKVESAIASNDPEQIRVFFIKFESELMRGVRKGVFKENTARRRLTRIARRIKKSGAK